MNIDYATQGIGGVEVELVARMWNDVGVKTNFKEVTPDEYRGSQSSNALDVHAWDKGQPLAIIAKAAPFGSSLKPSPSTSFNPTSSSKALALAGSY